MKKRIARCLASGWLIVIFAAAAAVSPGAETREETATEQIPAEESGTEKPPLEVALNFSAEDIENAIITLEEVDYDELVEDLNVILKIVESEDFQSLMSYQEVRELTVLLLEKMEVFVTEEPELTAKVCETLGVHESIALLIPDLIRIYDYSKDDIEAMLQSEENMKTAEAAKLILVRPETAGLVRTILQELAQTGL